MSFAFTMENLFVTSEDLHQDLLNKNYIAYNIYVILTSFSQPCLMEAYTDTQTHT